jgi:small-conductance mechanosensitive channel
MNYLLTAKTQRSQRRSFSPSTFYVLGYSVVKCVRGVLSVFQQPAKSLSFGRSTVMTHRLRKSFIVCGLGLLALLVSTAVWAKNPMLFGAGGSKKEQKAAPAAQVPTNLTPGQVDHYLATLSDQQARQALAEKLKQQAATPSPGQEPTRDLRMRDTPFGRLFYGATEGTSSGIDRIRAVFSGGAESTGTLGAALDKLTGGKGAAGLAVAVAGLLVIMGAGLLGERLLVRATEGIRHQLVTALPLGKLEKLGLVLSRSLLDALGICLYVLVTFVLFVLVYDQQDAAYLVVPSYLIGSYYLKIIMFAATVLLAPRAPGLRLVPLADGEARFLYAWMLRITAVAVVLTPGAFIFREAGASEALFTLMYCAVGLAVTLLLIVMIWQARTRVAQAICHVDGGEACAASSLRATLAKSWHGFAILYVVFVGLSWQFHVLTGGRVTIVKMIMSLFLIPLFIAVDAWLQRLLKIASGEFPQIIDLSGDDEVQPPEADQAKNRNEFRYYVPVIRRLFRVMLILFAFFIILRLWGIDLQIGQVFTSHVLSIFVALLLGFVVWEFTKARIDAKLREEIPEQDEDMEEGGVGGSRRGTLLVLLRKFILTFLFITVSLIVLASIGVQIGPLLAGAGVIGIAIGFGAQTLVRDIISGIFFLIDDAFRVGDYVESGNVKGTVEHISLRSLKLRHPRGMVYTIPFGRMASVTNYSRDYIITKLDIRVRFDTDLGKVKKIVKKINKDIMKEEEFKRVLLDDIRSAGVREMDDSALIVRVKFKTLPGEQFVMRREVYHRITQSFREQGIEFAHRDVTVYLPPELRHSLPQPDQTAAAEAPAGNDKALLGVAAAAARAAALADEEKKKGQLESKKPKDGGGE